MKVKMFVALGHRKLEQDINFWIEENSGKIDIIDIRMSNCSDGTHGNTEYSVIIMYCERQLVLG